MSKYKILFVCMGNICRSPSAEGAFRGQVKKRGLEHLFEIDSAGTHAYHLGEKPDRRAQQSANKFGVDLSNQRARQVHESDFYYYDYIIAMDTSNISNLFSICPKEHQNKLSLMLDNLPDSQGQSVPDPYFEGRFDDVFLMLNSSSENLLNSLI
jgi:protein-tyrosine phosphatase